MGNSFIEDIRSEGQVLILAAETAWQEAKADLSSLEHSVLLDLQTAISTVISNAERGATVEELETMVLNLLQAEVVTILKGLTSGALQVLIVFAKSAL